MLSNNLIVSDRTEPVRTDYIYGWGEPNPFQPERKTLGELFRDMLPGFTPKEEEPTTIKSITFPDGKKFVFPNFEIEKVIFNEPATIVFWKDGTKTVVKCGENDEYDPEKGIAMCFAKKALGNTGHYYQTFKKHLPDGYFPSKSNATFTTLFADDKPICDIFGDAVSKFKESLRKHNKPKEEGPTE